MADPTAPTLLQVLHERMNYLAQRQKVLSENIANANTPGYAARDLRDSDFTKALQHESGQLQMTSTNPNHLPPVSPSTRFAVDKVKSPYETKLDKNSVVLDEQLGKMAQTAGGYSTATQVYKKYVEMLKMAAKSQ
jgi:flagellar basal-body rod protein FlgB